MSDRQTQSVKRIFFDALDVPPSERLAFVRRHCDGDSALHDRVLALLEANDEAGEFLAEPTIEGGPSVPAMDTLDARDLALVQEAASAVAGKTGIDDGAPLERPAVGPGSRVGRYKLLQEIGEGGFGVVYLAEQQEPVRRRVALKVIKKGMDTKQVIARFEAERQALAMMNHPNIARVFDAATTDNGRPYFVMEFVNGAPITKYCDDHKMPPRKRLELFRTVCLAVRHAHQKGIIHRDIKPTNILVTTHDGEPVPKVIDFGIAKATSKPLTERTLFTEFQQLVGTPQYMSPEQADLGSMDVDTRSDVYSLGVVLYELLTGSPPFDSERLRSAGYAEMQRIIKDEEPPRPSTRLSTMKEQLARLAELRQLDTSGLAKLLRGDLDWITMRALDKNPARRYQTANAFADDISRFLNDEPVDAGPPGAAYRMRKFARRHRVPLGVVSLVLLALVSTAAVATFGYFAVRAERDLKEQAVLQTMDALEKEQKARAESEAVTTFLVNMLSSVRPEKQGKDIAVRDVLDKAARTINEGFAKRPLIQAQLHHTIGKSYWSLGLPDEAEPHVLTAVALYREHLGDEDDGTLRAIDGLANISFEQGHFAIAEELHRQSLEIRQRTLGADHPDNLQNLEGLAALYDHKGRFRMAEELFKQALDAHRSIHGDEHERTLKALNNYGQVLNVQGRYAEAEPLLTQCLATRRRVLGKDYPNNLTTMSNLGLLYKDTGRWDEAERMYLDAIALCSEAYGEDNIRAIRLLNNLANVFRRQNRFSEAEARLREALAIQANAMGTDHINTLRVKLNLGGAIAERGDYDTAEPILLEVHEAALRILGPEHPETVNMAEQLAECYWRRGDKSRAAALYTEALETRKLIASRSDADAGTLIRLAATLLAHNMEDLREPQLALTLAKRANEMTRYADPGFLQTLAKAHHANGDPSQAVERMQRAIDLVPPGFARLREELEESMLTLQATDRPG